MYDFPCYYCPYRLYMLYYYWLHYANMHDYKGFGSPDPEIDQELAPDLFDLIPENIFQELNPEGIPGVPGIPGEQAFPQITPKP